VVQSGRTPQQLTAGAQPSSVTGHYSPDLTPNTCPKITIADIYIQPHNRRKLDPCLEKDTIEGSAPGTRRKGTVERFQRLDWTGMTTTINS